MLVADRRVDSVLSSAPSAISRVASLIPGALLASSEAPHGQSRQRKSGRSLGGQRLIVKVNPALAVEPGDPAPKISAVSIAKRARSLRCCQKFPASTSGAETPFEASLGGFITV